jgi:putative transposase
MVEELRVAKDHETEPGAAILDSQSVKTTVVPGVRGYDAAKKVKGRERHILVDTIGLLLMVEESGFPVESRYLVYKRVHKPQKV